MVDRARIVFGGILTAAFFAGAAALSLSDRVGHRVRADYRFGLSVLSEFERLLAIDVVDRSDLPFKGETLGHAALWGVGMLLAGSVLRQKTALLPLAAVVLALSVSVEIGQGVLSSTRTPQVGDAIANLAGIAMATTVIGLYSLVERWLGNPRNT
ncbi:MAG: hypothetical protein KJN71_10180 [Acidimicrobiia bacterium]|nr:hypothetical protein [Acidimicrobiia bacterium]